MATPPEFVFRVVITNERALRALGVVWEYLEDEADGREWDAGLARAMRAMKYAMRNLTIRESDADGS